MSVNSVSGLNQYISAQNIEPAVPGGAESRGNFMAKQSVAGNSRSDQGQNQDIQAKGVQRAFKIEITGEAKKLSSMEELSSNRTDTGNTEVNSIGTGSISASGQLSEINGKNMQAGNAAPINNANNKAANGSAGQQARQIVNIVA